MKKLLVALLLGTLSGSVTAKPAIQAARFEHVFAVLDEDTAKAIAKSSYMVTFSGVSQKTTVSAEGHYSGLYVYGVENYVELFGPHELDLDGPPAAVGVVGLGLCTERVDGLEPMKQAMGTSGAPFEIQSFKKTLGDRSVDWFRGLGLPSAFDGSAETSGVPVAEIFTSEYIPSYFDVPEANKAPSNGPEDTVSLSRYHRRDYSHGLMRNVIGVTLAITRADWQTFEPMLRAAGYRIAEKHEGAQAVGDVTISFTFVDRSHVGIRSIDFVLNGSPTHHVETLGHSQLEVGPGPKAHWTFTAPAGR